MVIGLINDEVKDFLLGSRSIIRFDVESIPGLAKIGVTSLEKS